MSRHPDAPPATGAVQIANVRSGWCTDCKAWTQLVGEALLLTADGVTLLGTWVFCEICSDTDDREGKARVR